MDIHKARRRRATQSALAYQAIASHPVFTARRPSLFAPAGDVGTKGPTRSAPDDAVDTAHPRQPDRSSSRYERTIQINLTLPALFELARWSEGKKKLPKKSRKLLVIITAIGAVMILGAYFLVSKRTSTTPKIEVSGVIQKTGSSSPTFKTDLPAGKTIGALGGWTRVSPPNRNPVFAYTDKIGNTLINVSQQPLPEEFKSDTANQIGQLANDYKATEKVTVGNIVIYIGTSAKGPQSVICSKDNLLILIKSSVRVSTDQWIKYINTLS